jgi:hypothetical protein
VVAVSDLVVAELLTLDADEAEARARTFASRAAWVVDNVRRHCGKKLPEGMRRKDIAAGMVLGAERWARLAAELALDREEASARAPPDDPPFDDFPLDDLPEAFQ